MSKIIFKFNFYIISPKSFDDLHIWLKNIKDNANPDLKVFLLGNKSDLEDSRIINKEEGIDIKNEFNLDLFKESAVKEEKKCTECFFGSN